MKIDYNYIVHKQKTRQKDGFSL